MRMRLGSQLKMAVKDFMSGRRSRTENELEFGLINMDEISTSPTNLECLPKELILWMPLRA
jgi:hypothetical protein